MFIGGVMIDLQVGCHLMVSNDRSHMEKHAIYAGINNEQQYVVTLHDDLDQFTYSPPCVQTLDDFFEGYDTYTTFTYKDDVQKYRGQQIVSRALMQTEYSDESISFITDRNFVEWCITGEPLKEDKWKWQAYHVKVARTGYDHHGIYLGTFDGYGVVIHYSGFAKAFDKGEIEITTLDEFRGDSEDIYVVDYLDSEKIYGKFEIIDRAFSKLGENEYNLFSNNCEHFACWCITGKSNSAQVEKVRSTTVTTLITLDQLGIASIDPLTLYSLGASKSTTAVHAISKYLTPGVTPAIATVGATLLSKIFKR